MTDTTVPLARRLRLSPWRDRRLLLGIVLVLASTVAGATLLSSSRATQTHWVLATDVRAGETVNREQVRPIDVHVPGDVQDSLLALDTPPRSGHWNHDLAQGSLVTKTAIESGVRHGQHVPILLGPGGGPFDLAVGDRINVWIGPDEDDDSTEARRVLTDVPVVAVETDAVGGGHRVVLDVGVDGPTPGVVAAVASGHLTAVRIR